MPLLYQEETFLIRGAAYRVHSLMGSGFPEVVYQEALEKEFIRQGIPYEREKLIPLYYDGERLEAYFKADFLCYGKIVVELKALAELLPENQAQVINYLKATGCELGLLMNFGESSMHIERIYRRNDGIYAPKNL